MTPPTAIDAPPLAETFRALVTEWREDFHVRFSPDPGAASHHPAYRKMVALGSAIVPLIFTELEASPSPAWLAALEELTGADPVPRADWGYPRRMATHWLAWGRACGLA